MLLIGILYKIMSLIFSEIFFENFLGKIGGTWWAGGGYTKAFIACGDLTPYLCYGAFSRGNRTQEIFQMHKTKFSLRTVTFWRYGTKSSGPIRSLVTNKNQLLYVNKGHCLRCGMAEPPKRNVIPILQMRSCMLL